MKKRPRITFHFVELAVLSCIRNGQLLNVYKGCPKMISLEKLQILTPLHKLPKNAGDLGKLNCYQRL